MTVSEHEDDYDVVVVGGGPGGSTAATLIARAGHSVLLLEREQHPRYQIGESLLPATIHGVCSLLGIDDEVHAAGFVRKYGAMFRWGTSEGLWGFGFSQSPMLDKLGANYAYQVERSAFDALLFRNAGRWGARARERCEVRDVLRHGDRIVGLSYADLDDDVLHTVRARYVVDASGYAGRLYRHVGNRVHSEFFRNVGTFGYFVDGGRLGAPHAGNILCEAVEDGWVWYIPLRMEAPNLTSVGAVLGSEASRREPRPGKRVLHDAIARSSRVRSLLARATPATMPPYDRIRTRRDWSYTNERFWAPGMALIGDAACFVDPVLSTGVHLATYAALLAARSINSCLAGTLDEGRAFDEFELRYRREYEAFYSYLIAFYEMHDDEAGYFWKARKVLNTDERDNEAFVRLVAGCATSPDLYFDARAGIGDALQGFADQLGAEVPAQVRERLTPSIGRRLARFAASPGDAPAPVGLDELYRTAWGQRDEGQPPRDRSNGLVASADGLHWQEAP